MTVYLDLALALNFAVDLLLLIAANRLMGYPVRILPTLSGALLGAVYGMICFLPGMAFLGGDFWRLVVMAGMCVIAFGANRSALRRGAIFILLSLSLGGFCLLSGSEGFGAVCLSAVVICGICILIAKGNNGAAQYVTVFLRRGERERRVLALRDSGNTLTDPITGSSVLIAGSDIAWDLLGLTQSQLRDPICTVATGTVDGARLIPYRSVGQANGMLLAVRLDEVRINDVPAERIVAFAPDWIGNQEGYQALTGGIV